MQKKYIITNYQRVTKICRIEKYKVYTMAFR